MIRDISIQYTGVLEIGDENSGRSEYQMLG